MGRVIFLSKKTAPQFIHCAINQPKRKLNN